MIEYLLVALIWGMITEFIFDVTEEKLNFQIRVINFLFFPIIFCIFTYYFIKEFNKQS